MDSLYYSGAYSDPSSVSAEDTEEAWVDSVKKCNINKRRTEDDHHSHFAEVSCKDDVKELIKEKIRSGFKGGQMYKEIIGFHLNNEITLLKNRLMFPERFMISKLISPEYNEYFYGSLYNSADIKFKQRVLESKKLFEKQLDSVSKEVVRKMDGVVRVQRPTTTNRERGTGTGIVVRLGLSRKHKEKDAFFILTNNHIIADESEAKGAEIVFFYDEAANNTSPGSAPPGVVKRPVKELIKYSPKVPSGQLATDDNLDFSILSFDTSTDKEGINFNESEFIDKLWYCCFSLNEYQESDLPNKPFMPFTNTIPLIAISHPHGSNKRISFGILNEQERERMCNETDHCDVNYNVPTCKGSSGCPVIALLVNSRGYLKPALQFLHFRSGRGIDLYKLYTICNKSRSFHLDDWLNCHEMAYGKIDWLPIWCDESDRERYSQLEKIFSRHRTILSLP